MKRPEKGGRASEEDLKDSPGCNKVLCSKFFLSEVIICPSLHAWRKSNMVTDRNVSSSSPLGGDVDLCIELIWPSFQQTNITDN